MADPVWKRKGFKSQFEYRSYLAQLQGYTGYHAQRVAREVFRNTGDDSLLRGTDIAKFSPKSVIPAQEGLAIGRPSAHAFPRTHLYEYDAKVQEIPIGLISRKKFDGRYPKAGTITTRALPQAHRQIDRVFPASLNLEDPESFISAAFRAGVRNGITPGQDVAEVARFARDTSHWQDMAELNHYMRSELHGGVDRWSRSARQWDALASRVTNEKEAKRQAKSKITAWVNDEGSYRMGLAQRERVLYDRAVTRAFNRGFFAACQFNNVEFFTVSDGPQCGWTDHNDPDLANGKVVTPEEALENPQAHPFCRRAFFPLRGSDGKQRHDESKERAAKLSTAQKVGVAAGGVAAAAAAYLGVTAEITTPAFQGTVGDFVLNGIGEGLKRAMGRMLAVKDRIIATMSKRFAAAGFDQRLNQIALELADETGLDIQQVKDSIIAQVHAEAEEFAESNVTSLMTRRVIGVPEQRQVLPRVVGDRLNLYEGYYRQTIKNEVLEGVPGADRLAELLNNQDFIHQVLFNSTRFQGRFFRFSLPQINTIDGNTGKRITSRYGRLSLSPNNLFHLHASIKPEGGTSNALRLITNLKINPNGMVRMGFVKGEDGIIRPNLSLVPKGPLRVYSRANRAGPTVKRTEEAWEWVTHGIGKQLVDEGKLVKYVDPTTGEEKAFINAVRTNIGADAGEANKVWALVRREVELPNVNRGRVNSITTEVRLITKWVPFSDSMWYKFRVNLSALGIKSPEDIKNISVVDWRRWRSEQKNKFDWISAGVNMRLRGGNLFDFSRSLRIDPTTQHRIRNVEKNIDELFSLFTEGITPSQEATLFESGMVVNPLNGMPLRPSEVQGYIAEQRLKNVPNMSIGGIIKDRGRGVARSFIRDKTLDAAEFIMQEQAKRATGTVSTPGILSTPGERSIKGYLLDQYTNTAELYMRTKYLYNETSALPLLRDELDDFVAFMEAQAARGEANNETVNILKALAQDRKSPWQVAQGYWSMAKKETESRLEQLTDYMITMQRAGAVPPGAKAGPPPAVKAAQAKPKALNVEQALKFIEEGGIDELVTPTAELYYWDKPDLITAILQSDPKLLAQDVAERLPTLEQARATLMQDITMKWEQYKSVVPKQIADRVEDRLKGNILFSEGMGSTAETRLNNTGTLRWHSTDASRVFKPGAARNQGYSLREGFRPGDTLDTSDLGAVRLFDRVPESFKGLDAPDEVVEFYVDGVSTQRWRQGVPYLSGSYDVTGYSYMSRSGVGALHPFPEDMPEGVKVVHRIYVRQKGAQVPAGELIAATVDEPVLGAVAQAERARLFRDAYPQAVDDIVEYIGRPQAIRDALTNKEAGTRDGLIALRIKELIDSAPRLPNNLYRVVMGQDGDDLVEQLTDNPVMKETLGTWLPAVDKFPSGGTGTQRRVIVVLRNPKAINATPMLEEAPTLQEFITSGAYTFAHRYDDVTKNTTWIFMDYVRRL